MEYNMDMNSMNSTLHIGDVGEYLYEFAFKWSGPSRLIDSNNINQFGAGCYHTSLGDISQNQMIELALQADQVVYLQPEQWSSPSIQSQTEAVVNYISHRKKVLEWTRPCVPDDLEYPQINTMTTTQPKLWVFGCSHSHGSGLPDLEKQSYAHLLADKLNHTLIKVTRPGTSTRWSLKHLINANIGPHDIVIWQPTTLGRLTVVDSEIKTQYLDQLPKEYLETYNDILTTYNSTELHLKDLPREYYRVYNDEQLLFDHLSLLNTGTRYCETNNIKLIMTSLDRDQSTAVRNYISRYKQWTWTDSEFQDHGLDNTHAGPKTHAKLADDLYEHAKFLGYI